MRRHLAAVSVLVRDYDEAIAHYTQDLGFILVEDSPRPDGKRWVRVAPPGSDAGSTCLLLARAATPEQVAQDASAEDGYSCSSTPMISIATMGACATAPPSAFASNPAMRTTARSWSSRICTAIAGT